MLGGLLACPARPFVAVVGGAKVADKLDVLKALATKVDTLIVGGGMAFTFLAAQGPARRELAAGRRRIWTTAGQLLASGVEILLPTDTRALEPGGTVRAAGGGRTGRGGAQGDRGRPARRLDRARHRARHGRRLRRSASAGQARSCGTGRWARSRTSGSPRARKVVAQAVAECAGFSVVGGGDSASALEELGLVRRGGTSSRPGAARRCAFIERGGHLPGARRAAPGARTRPTG